MMARCLPTHSCYYSRHTNYGWVRKSFIAWSKLMRLRGKSITSKRWECSSLTWMWTSPWWKSGSPVKEASSSHHRLRSPQLCHRCRKQGTIFNPNLGRRTNGYVLSTRRVNQLSQKIARKAPTNWETQDYPISSYTSPTIRYHGSTQSKRSRCWTNKF